MAHNMMTLDEFCELVRITPRTFHNLRSKGEVPPSLRVGRRILMRREVVAEWIEQRETAAQAA